MWILKRWLTEWEVGGVLQKYTDRYSEGERSRTCALYYVCDCVHFIINWNQVFKQTDIHVTQPKCSFFYEADETKQTCHNKSYR